MWSFSLLGFCSLLLLFVTQIHLDLTSIKDVSLNALGVGERDALGDRHQDILISHLL